MAIETSLYKWLLGISFAYRQETWKTIAEKSGVVGFEQARLWRNCEFKVLEFGVYSSRTL